MFSLKNQIYRFVIIGSVIVLILMTIGLSLMVNFYQKNQDDVMKNNMEKYAETMENQILQMSEAIRTIYSNNNAFDALKYFNSAALEYDNIYELQGLLQIQIKSNRNLGGIFVYYDNANKLIYSLEDRISFDDKEYLKNFGQRFVVGMSDNYSDFVIKAEEEIYYNMVLRKNHVAIMGSVQLSLTELDYSSGDCIYGIFSEGNIYGINGEISQEEKWFQNLKYGRNIVDRHVIYYQELEIGDLAVVAIFPQTLELYFSGVHVLIFILMITLVYIFVQLSDFIYRKISKPLEDMTQVLSQIQAGEWEAEFHVSNKIAEIEDIRQTVNVMLREIEKYKIQSYEDAIERQNIQLQYLKLQLAPHFYTNCIKNAYYMLMMNEYNNVGQFLLCLSNHLRYLLQSDLEMVTLQEEKIFVQNYFSLQNMLSNQENDYELAIEDGLEEEILQEKIPILSIQTFVENSIKYGISEEGQKQMIRVRIRYRFTEIGKFISILVQDNGVGYSREILETLNQDEIEDNQKFGVGIINLLRRVRIYYGKEAHWYFDNNKGACSELLLPVVERENK